ncbi:MAG: oligosaccharide flippase family protein [Acidobacteria bacterium]|nr:oligosaccharide flippase family protein [Acidobacteriota bacterium]
MPMSEPQRSPFRATLAGGAWLLVADSLFVPTALVISVFLARRLGPSQYGLFALAATVIGWVEWLVASFFSRAAIRQIAVASDWRPVGSAIVRAMLAVGVAIGALLAICAGPAGALLGDRAVVPLLYLAALSAPLAGLALSHRLVLTGLERFRARAVASSIRWIGRLVLVLVLVQVGFGVNGAVVATVAATALELVAARWFVRPSLLAADRTPWRELGRLAAPLFLAGVSVRAFERVDLLCLQAIGGRTADTGMYGAAQSLAALPGFVATAFAPVLLSSVSRLVAVGDGASAHRLSREALHCAFWLAPVAAVVAVASGEIVRLMFGQAFAAAGPILAVLSVASLANVELVLASTLLVAHDRVGTTVAIAAPLVPVAIVGHLLAIPRFGGFGAAVVTATVSWLAAGVALLVLKRVEGIGLFVSSAARVRFPQ